MIPVLATVIQGATLALLTACAQHVGTHTMAGLVTHESAWQRFAIGDNSTRTAFFPTNYKDAVTLVRALRDRGHSLDAGLAQVDTENWAKYGLTPENVFDPCLNVAVGADILAHAYQGAVANGFHAGDDALRHALSRYNSGKYYAALGYAAAVIGLARDVHEQYIDVPDPRRVTPLLPKAKTRPRPSRPLGVAARWATPYAPPIATVVRWGTP